MSEILVFVIVLAAAFLQSLSGFGFALIIMPLITIVLGLQTAAPLVALAGLTVYSINLIRYLRAIDLGEVLRMGGASLLGVPFGIWVLANADESVVRLVLGIMLIVYGVYALARPATSYVLSRHWAYPAGFVAGCLGGAYNTPGPPAVVYGSLRQWPKDEFRAAMQAFFFVNALLVVTVHSVAHHITPGVFSYYRYALPALLLGIVIAAPVDGKLNRERFRLMVNGLILVLGVSLVLGLGN
jgi:uncharacterized membrane protein YfcA